MRMATREALLPSSAGPRRRSDRWLSFVAAAALFSVAMLGVALTAGRGAPAPSQLASGVARFGVDHGLERLADNGEKCWMCPCCAGCEGTGAARAAGCSMPGLKDAHKEAERQAVRASKKQAKLQDHAEADSAGQPMAAAKAPAADTPEKPAAAAPSKPGKQASPTKVVAAGTVKKAAGAKDLPAKDVAAKVAVSKPAAAPKKRLHMKHLQMKVEKVGDDDPRPISDNDNRLKDDMDMFEDASYLNPHKYHIPHLTKKMKDGYLHEDVIAPWITGADRFKERTQFNEDGTIKSFKHYDDPAGLFVENPADEEPWDFSEGKHWDRLSPENHHFEHGEDWSHVGDTKFVKGEMTHGDNKKWEDVDDPQWGFQHQFADWDPDSDANMRLMWGEGGLAKSGEEMPNDARLDDATNIYEEPAMHANGNKPWELTWMDPRLEGDDFVGKEDYLKSMHPKFANPEDNQFGNLDEEGDDNKNLVFGDNEGASPSSKAAIDAGKDDPAALRQRMDVPINDNWNFVSDSAVNSDTVKDLLVDRSASIMPMSGEPFSDALTAGWQGTNGVGHSDGVVWLC
jgi:hypothetical protein